MVKMIKVTTPRHTPPVHASAEFKHTPGPWVVSKTSGLQIFINHATDSKSRVPGYFAEVRRFTTDHEQVEANARLIAAAPKMLTKLIEAANYIDTLGGDSKQYRAAIAKATGE